MVYSHLFGFETQHIIVWALPNHCNSGSGQSTHCEPGFWRNPQDIVFAGRYLMNFDEIFTPLHNELSNEKTHLLAILLVV